VNGTGFARTSELRILTQLERAALAAYCGAYELWAEAAEAIQKYGSMTERMSRPLACGRRGRAVK
jgi:phage terminase small subunit